MSGCRSGPQERRRTALRRWLPPEINHVVLTGTLSSQPQDARGPAGDRVTLLQVEFPVAHPDDSLARWKRGTCLVEVLRDRSRKEGIEGLRGGDPVIAAGQRSDRWMIENGHTNRRGVILATLVKSGPPTDHLVIGPP